jgi:hypothetical protein
MEALKMKNIKIDPNFIKAAEEAAVKRVQGPIAERSMTITQDEIDAKLLTEIRELLPKNRQNFEVTSQKSEVTYFEDFETTWPTDALKRHYSFVLGALSLDYDEVKRRSPKLALFFDFNHWLKVSGALSEFFGSDDPVLPDYLSEKVFQILKEIVNKQPENAQESLYNRLEITVSWLWYTCLSVFADPLATEFENFTEMIETADCLTQLENVSFGIQVFAGWKVDDRDAYLDRLRKIFTPQLKKLENKVCNGCYCGANKLRRF